MLATILFSLLSSRLPSKELKINLHKTRILLVVLCGYGTLSFTLRENRLRVFENRVLRRIFGPKREEGCVMRSSVTCTFHRILLGCSYYER
jgi:hypothetical protein